MITLHKYLFRPKHKIPADLQNNIVYKIPCRDYEATYIGESKISFKVRSSEHMRAVKNRDTYRNEIADHCWKKSHQMNWDNKKVIDLYARKIKELIHSIKDNQWRKKTMQMYGFDFAKYRILNKKKSIVILEQNFFGCTELNQSMQSITFNFVRTLFRKIFYFICKIYIIIARKKNIIEK